MRGPIRIPLLGALLVVALVSFVFVRSHQGYGDSFVVRQQHSQALSPVDVSDVVKAAPDPVALPRHEIGVQGLCNPGGSGALLNPWRCSIRYASGRLIGYLVTIHADGSYVGDHELVRYRGQSYRDTGVITGCCINVP
jgi:hypothetical protein